MAASGFYKGALMLVKDKAVGWQEGVLQGGSEQEGFDVILGGYKEERRIRPEKVLVLIADR